MTAPLAQISNPYGGKTAFKSTAQDTYASGMGKRADNCYYLKDSSIRFMDEAGTGRKEDLSTFYSTEGFNYEKTPYDWTNSPTFKS